MKCLEGRASILLLHNRLPIVSRSLYMAWLGFEDSRAVPSPILRQMACYRFTLLSQDGSGVEFVFNVMMKLSPTTESFDDMCYTLIAARKSEGCCCDTRTKT